MRTTYKFRLYPTPAQPEKIQFTVERCRLLYNRLLDERRVAYAADKTTLNYFDQANTLSERKQYIPALKQVHSQVLQDVVKRLDKAFQTFFRRVKAGEKPGYPRFKSVNRYDSFTYPQGGYAIHGNTLTLSKIGEVKIKLHRPPQGKIKTCTVVVKNGKYYACLSCEVEPRSLPHSENAVGID
jgi:putative transposase